MSDAAARQMAAALDTLGDVMSLCPDTRWDEKLAELRCCQVFFHTLFYTDVYLGWDVASAKAQPFHAEHRAVFGDYEELHPVRQQALYERGFLQTYLAHCRAKAFAVIPHETEAQRTQRPGFEWLDLPRAEVHLYNLRHVQHHAAAVGLQLRIHDRIDLRWRRTGDVSA